ncbi:MAG: hypothetical protein IH789_09880 [Acidobacteria bacterium]|nr:hypothetical protein [Acidobacteriota bacterium]
MVKVVEGAREAPVVLVLGDHGPGLGLDHDSLEHSDLEERFGVLLAAHLPPDLAGALTEEYRQLVGDHQRRIDTPPADAFEQPTL